MALHSEALAKAGTYTAFTLVIVRMVALTAFQRSPGSLPPAADRHRLRKTAATIGNSLSAALFRD